MEKQVFRPIVRNWLDRVVGPIVLLWALFAKEVCHDPVIWKSKLSPNIRSANQ